MPQPSTKLTIDDLFFERRTHAEHLAFLQVQPPRPDHHGGPTIMIHL